MIPKHKAAIMRNTSSDMVRTDKAEVSLHEESQTAQVLLTVVITDGSEDHNLKRDNVGRK